jgi:hypothetical protein
MNCPYSIFIVLFSFMGRPGFEPETNRLKAECSTAELATREYKCTAHIY